MPDIFAIIACVFIFASSLWAYLYVKRIPEEELKNKQNWITQLPSIISTLGVIGTFVGITRGLLDFQPSDPTKSIPILLDGLKTAFYTSLFGMSGSLILNKLVSSRFDSMRQSKDSDVIIIGNKIIEAIKSSSNQIAAQINASSNDVSTNITNACESTKMQISKSTESQFTKIEELIRNRDESLSITYSSISQLAQSAEQIKDDLEIIKVNLENSIMNNSHEIDESLLGVMMTATESVTSIDNNLVELMKQVKDLADK